MPQMDLFPQPVVVESTVPLVETVRARFEALLAPLRAATQAMPLTPRELAYWEAVAPQMANWLPLEEREAVCSEFAAHVARLKRAA